MIHNYSLKGASAFLIALSFLLCTSVHGQKGIASSDTNAITRQPSFIRFKQDSLPILNNLQKFFGQFLPLRSGDELRVSNQKTDAYGYTHIFNQQYYKNVRVIDGEYIVHTRDGKVTTVNGNFHSVGNVSVTPKLTEAQALESALGNIGATVYKWQIPAEEAMFREVTGKKDTSYYPKGQLVIKRGTLSKKGQYRLSYMFNIYAHKPFGRYLIFIDALTGEILYKEDLIMTVNSPGLADTRYSGPQAIVTDSYTGGFRLRETRGANNVSIQTYNMQAAGSYGNAIDYSDGDNDWTAAEYDNANEDDAALDAHWGTEQVFDYFSQVRGRNSWNNSGGNLLGYAHADLHQIDSRYPNSDNAFWDGSKMTYGMGTNFQSFTSLDIIAHEIGHGICQASVSSGTGVGNTGEAGALNEGLSDIWAACVKQWAAPGKPIWLMASDVVPGGLRSMSDPKAFGQPDTYGGTNWQNVAGCTPNANTNDNCFVHNNMSVLTYWFFLISQGGAGTNDLGNAWSVTGLGIATAASIVYQAETNGLMTNGMNYSAMRSAMITAATQIYGAFSCQTVSVTDAWHAVGIGEAFDHSTLNSISGLGTLCTSSSYTLTNTSGINSVTWSASPSGVVSLSTTNGLSTTVTKLTDGLVTLSATAPDVCNTARNVNLTRQVIVGTPADFYILADGVPSCEDRIIVPISFYIIPFNTGATNGYSYAWSWHSSTGSGGTMPGNGSTNTRKFSPGSYTVSATGINSCGETDPVSTQFNIIACQSAAAVAVQAWPSPASDVVNVSVTDNSGSTPADVKAKSYAGTGNKMPIRSVVIYDATGRLRKTVQASNSTQVSVDVKDLPAGTYFLEIFGDGESGYSKLIVIQRH